MVLPCQYLDLKLDEPLKNGVGLRLSIYHVDFGVPTLGVSSLLGVLDRERKLDIQTRGAVVGDDRVVLVKCSSGANR